MDYNLTTGEHKLVWPKEIDFFIKQKSWELGKGPQTLEQRAKVKDLHKDTTWMFNSQTNIEAHVKKDRIEEYLSQGFVIGRSPLFSTEEKRAQRALNGLRGAAVVRGTTWIHRGQERKRVQSTELNSYLANGWETGHALVKIELKRDIYFAKESKKAAEELGQPNRLQRATERLNELKNKLKKLITEK